MLRCQLFTTTLSPPFKIPTNNYDCTNVDKNFFSRVVWDDNFALNPTHALGRTLIMFRLGGNGGNYTKQKTCQNG